MSCNLFITDYVCVCVCAYVRTCMRHCVCDMFLRQFSEVMHMFELGGHSSVSSHSTVTHVTFSLKIKFESCINSIITTVDL